MLYETLAASIRHEQGEEFEMKPSPEQLTAIITQVVAFLVFIAKALLPADWQPFVPFVVMIVEAVGALIVYLYAQRTKAQIASLQIKVKSLGG